jgi:hypothetical protein
LFRFSNHPQPDQFSGQRNAAAMVLINVIYNLARCEQIVRLKLLPWTAA